MSARSPSIDVKGREMSNKRDPFNTQLSVRPPCRFRFVLWPKSCTMEHRACHVAVNRRTRALRHITGQVNWMLPGKTGRSGSKWRSRMNRETSKPRGRWMAFIGEPTLTNRFCEPKRKDGLGVPLVIACQWSNCKVTLGLHSVSPLVTLHVVDIPTWGFQNAVALLANGKRFNLTDAVSD